MDPSNCILCSRCWNTWLCISLI